MYARIWNKITPARRLQVLKEADAWGYPVHNSMQKWTNLTPLVQDLVFKKFKKSRAINTKIPIRYERARDGTMVAVYA